MIDILRNGLQNIFRKKLRSSLTIAGIAIGIMAVVVISMIGEIGKATVQEELASMGIGGVVITSDSSKEIGFGNVELKQVQDNAVVTNASPFLTKYSAARMKQIVSDCWVWGIAEDTAKIVSMELLHGRMLNGSDIAGRSRVCMVDESYALANYKRSNIVGKTIEIAFDGVYQKFTIVGVAKAGGSLLQSMMGNVVPCFTYVPYTTMQSLSMLKGFSQIVAQVDAQNTDMAVFTETLTTQMSNSTGTNVKVEDMNSQMEQLSGIMDSISTVLTVIAGISLLVAGLSIMTVMLVSVGERTKEIGIKKSIGASKKVILMEFMAESFLITGLGAVVGIVTGLTLGCIGCWILGVKVIIKGGLLLLCLFFAVVVGMLFGIYPAWKAASLKPVDALRS